MCFTTPGLCTPGSSVSGFQLSTHLCLCDHDFVVVVEEPTGPWEISVA